MKGNTKIIAALNERLSEELAAISQYMVHGEMCANWGYKGLSEKLEGIAKDEMKHAELLIGRIIFLEGSPEVSKLAPIQIGQNVKEIIGNDHKGELGAVKSYNQTIALTLELSDNGTREMIDGIVRDEEGHVDWEEMQRDLIAQMGLENYLMVQVEKT